MTYAISPAGLAFIQEYEGFRPTPTQLPDGNWVVGYSHVRVAEPGADLSQPEAADLLTIDVAPVERMVNTLVTTPLTPSQFDALVSFAFSIGAEAFATSQVLRRVNAGDMVAAACAMDAWRKSDVSGELEIVDALVRRRAAEKALFLKDAPHDAAPSVFLRAKLDHAASILGAPVAYAATPAVGSIAVKQTQPESAQRLTEILKSEPATEALLLTQVVNDSGDEEGEIITAHAKPVARQFDSVRNATRQAFEAQEAKRRQPKGIAALFQGANKIDAAPVEVPADRRIRSTRNTGSAPRFQLPDFGASMEHVGLVALLLFGLCLIALGASLLIDGTADAIEVVAATAVTTPGIAATFMAAYGLWRTPRTVSVGA